MTVAELRRRVSSQEWMEWSVYYGRRVQQKELARMRGGGRGT